MRPIPPSVRLSFRREFVEEIGKRQNKTKGIAQAAKDRRRQEAEIRDQKYLKISLDERIARAKPGSKEHKKLLILKGPHS